MTDELLTDKAAPDSKPTEDGPGNDPIPERPNADGGDEQGGEPTPGAED